MCPPAEDSDTSLLFMHQHHSHGYSELQIVSFSLPKLTLTDRDCSQFMTHLSQYFVRTAPQINHV